MKTKKIKNKKRDIKKLWAAFDNDNDNIEDKQKELVQVYNNCKITKRDNCELCGGRLYLSEERFLTCENKSCGIIYKDELN